MRDISLFTLGFLFLFVFSCSKDSEKIELLPDYNRIHQYKRNNINSNIYYQYNENKKYSHFSTGRYFSEVYKNEDSLVIDDFTTQISNAYTTRWAFKFNPNNITVYTYDNNMTFVQYKKVFQTNNNKIIKRIQTFWKPNINSEKYLDNYDFTLLHDENNNLIEIMGKRNESLSTNPVTEWREHQKDKDFTYFDHSFPNLSSFITFLPPELENILYIKGYRCSKNGIKSYNSIYIDYDTTQSVSNIETHIQSFSELEMEVKYSTDNNFYGDSYISFFEK